MSKQAPGRDYLHKVVSSLVLPSDHPLSKASTFEHQRVIYKCLNGSTDVDPSLERLLFRHHETETENEIAICIIENISSEWIIALGTAWGIPPEFFAEHARNPRGEPLWKAIMNPRGKWETWTPGKINKCTHKTGYFDGYFEHLAEDWQRSQFDQCPRRLEYHPQWGLQGNSKISYCRVSPCLYLILTDLPFKKLPSSGRTGENLICTHLCLYVPFSGNHGGLAIPQLYSQRYFSAFDCLVSFLGHRWHWQILFAEHLEDGAIQPSIFANFLAASLWRTNLEHLRDRIHLIAFKDVRRPSILINDSLHDRRQEMAGLQFEVRAARKWMLTDDIEQFLQKIKERPAAPHEMLEQIIEESDNLYQFLMDTFQLLIGSISVLDSQTSLEEAKRSTTLTQLAAVYLPLSLATGIFGMNIKEINGSNLSVWVVFVALAILMFGTVALLLMTGTIRNASLRKVQTWVKPSPRARKRTVMGSDLKDRVDLGEVESNTMTLKPLSAALKT